jgi:hypothetical protein
MTTMSERRAMLAVLAVTWSDYSVGWAYGGTDEIVAYVGAEPSWPVGRDGQLLKRARGRDGLCHVVSVIDEAGALRLWPLWWGYSAAWQGPAMLKTLPGKGIARMRRLAIPESGVHVDVPGRSVGVDHLRGAGAVQCSAGAIDGLVMLFDPLGPEPQEGANDVMSSPLRPDRAS